MCGCSSIFLAWFNADEIKINCHILHYLLKKRMKSDLDFERLRFFFWRSI